MSALPWFAMWSDFPTHPKTIRLCERLGDPNAGMYVVRLLAYCARYAQDGRIPADMLEHAAGWKRRSSLSQVLLETHFIESEGDRWILHGWTEKNGAHVRKHAKDNNKPNSARRNPPETPRGVSAGPLAGEERRGEDKQREALQLAPLVSPPVKAKKATTKKPVDPLRRVLSDALVAVYLVERSSGYGFGVADGDALTRLLTWSRDVSDHERRFRLALREPAGNYSYRVDTLALFATSRIWNHFAGASAAPVSKLAPLGSW